MSPPPEQDHIYKGCEIIFPDTAFFNASGVCELIVKIDKERCIKKIRNKDKYTPDAIHHAFVEAVWQRFRETEGHFELKYGPSILNKDEKEYERARMQRKATSLHERQEKLGKEVSMNVTSKDFAALGMTKKSSKNMLSKSIRSIASGGSGVGGRSGE